MANTQGRFTLVTPLYINNKIIIIYFYSLWSYDATLEQNFIDYSSRFNRENKTVSKIKN